MKIRHYGLIPAIVFLFGCSDPTAPSVTGTWGGEVASLVLSATGGQVSYTCGSGTIAAGWAIEPGGRFTATGGHSPGGGPIPPEIQTPRAARYDGRLFGNTLVFTVTLTDNGERLGPFYLRRGGPPVGDMCK